jgi:hypothetical protein
MEDLMDFTGGPPHIGGNPSLRLPPFWVEASASWFALAESKFRLRGVTDELMKFDWLVTSLPRESVRQVIDLVESPPDRFPYTVLKARLMSAHQLTDYQKIEKLLHMEPLGARKPSELLAAMLELSPRGQEGNIYFTHLFLRLLPRELRIMLGEDDHQDPRPLAEKADKLWAIHGRGQTAAAVAAVNLMGEELEFGEPAPVAAVRPFQGRGGQRGKGPAGRGRGGAASTPSPGPSSPSSGATAPSASAPMALAKLSSGLCRFHWKFGDQAFSCLQPCKWQGN